MAIKMLIVGFSIALAGIVTALIGFIPRVPERMIDFSADLIALASFIIAIALFTAGVSLAIELAIILLASVK